MSKIGRGNKGIGKRLQSHRRRRLAVFMSDKDSLDVIYVELTPSKVAKDRRS